MASGMASGALALLLALGLVLVAMPRAITLLRRLKAEQSIHEDLPETHQAKAGTPTMGGLVFILAAVTVTVWLAGIDVLTGPALALTLAFGGIGFLDDLLIARRGKNLGLRAREKLALQVLAAALVVLFLARPMGGALGAVQAPFSLFRLVEPLAGALGVTGALVVYAVLEVLFLVGLANAVNFSDGLDGLASGLTAIAAGAAVLLIPAGMQGSLGVFLLAIAGACLGFLWYNCNPSRVIMGDTGSLALGGALGAVALLTRTELLFFIIGAVYWAELFSVMIQVAYFKRTRRRVFRMAPIHHHFELVGWKEPQIVIRFWLVAIVAAAAAVALAHL
jgi:phospho-N-acetylmuramoyl-pentapeptide-transferase